MPIDRATLRADCARCAALCCVAPAFSASADFAIDKPAGRPCPNLAPDFRCTIHDRLRHQGFPGCTVYDCFGAGQQVTQITFATKDWRTSPDLAAGMFAAFAVMRDLHELLWYLAEAESLHPSAAVRDLASHLAELTHLDPDSLAGLKVAPLRESVSLLLGEISTSVRSGLRGREYRGADLIGRDLSHRSLRGANLRGAYLIGANLTGTDLRQADLIGADLRGARLPAANLSTTLFLTQPQINAATGTAATKLPPALRRPAHWST